MKQWFFKVKQSGATIKVMANTSGEAVFKVEQIYGLVPSQITVMEEAY